MPSYTIPPFTTLPTTYFVADNDNHDALSQVAMDATSAARTATFSYGSVRPRNALITWQLTAQSTASDIRIQCFVKVDGDNWVPVSSRQITDGIGQNFEFVDVTEVSGTDEDSHEYEIIGSRGFRVVVSSTDGGAGDLVDVQVAFA